MAQIDLKTFISPTLLTNTTPKGKVDTSTDFDTLDLIYLDNEEKYHYETTFPVTDWALVNGSAYSQKVKTLTGKQATASTWLRSSVDDVAVKIASPLSPAILSKCCALRVVSRQTSVRPAMRLNCLPVANLLRKYPEHFKINSVKDQSNCTLYHTLTFGEYPKSYVGQELNNELENAYIKNSTSALIPADATDIRIPTGKQYVGRINEFGRTVQYNEYEYKGQKYVRAEVYYDNEFIKEAEGINLPRGSFAWIKVEPLTWVIRNWSELPKSINPNSTGTSNHIDVVTEYAIATLPFNTSTQSANSSLWQNSTIRGYLNGINVNNIIMNGNHHYTASTGGDFSHENFLSDALKIDLDAQQNYSQQQTNTSQTSNTSQKVKNRKGYGVTILNNPMTVNEQIKFYIENGKSFMLHGPSGVGKTRRIEEADPDFISIVLRNGILPEEVIGKTIYPNNDKTTAGTWVPPAWYTDLCDKCAREPDKNHVLFIDEITNVRPSEQSLVFHLVLNNSIGPNIGLLPKNAVVVAAGNSKEESEAAYNMPEPLFRRFDGHIELKLDIQQWLEWGSEPSKKGNGRLKIHPLVSNFVGTYSNQVFYSPYDSEEPPKYAIDPRGWEQISDIIYDNNGVIAKELIENKVGKAIATSFVAFAGTPPLMVEDVISGNYDQSDIPSQFDAKYAVALSLRSANMGEIQKVREFIGKNLGNEILSMFDAVWVGDDSEKAICIANLPKVNAKQATHGTTAQKECSASAGTQTVQDTYDQAKPFRSLDNNDDERQCDIADASVLGMPTKERIQRALENSFDNEIKKFKEEHGLNLTNNSVENVETTAER